MLFVIWSNWSGLKRSFLVGSLSGQIFLYGPLRWTAHEKILPNGVVENFKKRGQFVCSRNLVLAFLPIILAKPSVEMPLQKSFVPLFRLCSARLLIDTPFAVRKLIKSHNNKSFIEMACSVRFGENIGLVPFMEVNGPHQNFQKKELDQYFPMIARLTKCK